MYIGATIPACDPDAWLAELASSDDLGEFASEGDADDREPPQDPDSMSTSSSGEITFTGTDWYSQCKRLFQEITREGQKGRQRQDVVLERLSELLRDVVAAPGDIATREERRHKYAWERR